MKRRLAIRLSVALLLCFGAWASAQPSAAGKKYALLVGINEYQGLGNLKFAENDVQELKKILETQGYEVRLVLGGKATKKAIEDELNATLEKCKKEDLLILAFAGHGLQFDKDKDAYFCPHDGRAFAAHAKTLVSLNWVMTQLEENCFAKAKVMFVDACRNNPDPTRKARGIDDARDLSPAKGIAAMFSCSANEVALELDDLKHGLFFYHVLAGLRGQAANSDGQVTFNSLADYVTNRVSMANKEQNPHQKSNLMGRSPVFALVPFRPDRPDPDPRIAGAWEWKAFEKRSGGFYSIETTRTLQKMVVMGQAVNQNQTQTFYVHWLPEDRIDGNNVVNFKIIGVKMDIDVGGNKISYDSTAANQNVKNPMTDFFDALIANKGLKYHVKPSDFSIVRIDGRDEFIQGLGNVNPQIKPLLQTILSDESLKRYMPIKFFPGEAVRNTERFRATKTFEKNETLDMGPIGVYKTKAICTVVSDSKIEVKTSMEYGAPLPQNQGGLAFVIKKADMRSAKGVGYHLFDRAKGRFTESSMEMDLNGKLTIEIGATETEVDLNQTQSAVTQYLDTNPIDALRNKNR